MKVGDRVRFTIAPLGALHPGTRRIVSTVEFNAGDEGTVTELVPSESKPAAMIRVERDGREYDVPIFVGMAEVIS